MAPTLPSQGVLRVVAGKALDDLLDQEDRARRGLDDPKLQSQDNQELTGLASHIRSEFEIFRIHRNSASGWSERLLSALRAFNGQYDPAKLAEIRKFGGSQVYARMIAMKCRGATSLLRDIYLSPERPWGIDPPEDPDIPPEVTSNIAQLVQMEAQSMSELGQPADVASMRDRTLQLMEAARDAAKKQAGVKANQAEDRIQEILNDGGFYKALAEALVDIPLFPFACIKGPVVRIVPTVSWNPRDSSSQDVTMGGNLDTAPAAGPTITQKPRLFWERVSPFDLWWTPGVSDIESAAVIERTRLTRADLNDLLDLPGYDHDAIRSVLTDYANGYTDDWDSTDSERAVQESRENPVMNRSGMITCLEYHGNVQGKLLLEFGIDKNLIPDEIRDYTIQAWLIGRHVIKVQLSPSPRRRHPYFTSSFEKVPGTPVGNGLPDILSDLQEVGNAVLRALVNNISISSGPQVVINDDRLAAGEDGEEMFPWKRWHVTSDPMGNNTQVPISFTQPVSNAQELLTVYKAFNDIADEVSAIPKHLAGQGAGGGAGRTAAGLAMLMGNASKILQTVAANIDRDMIEPLLHSLYDMLMLTDPTGMLEGDELIRVMGVSVAMQRETQRSRQLEFLQITANPIDSQIMGPKGRAVVLRSVGQTIGLDGEEIVPHPEEIERQMQAAQQQAQQAAMMGGAGGGDPNADLAQAGARAQGNQAPKGGSATQDMGPRETGIARPNNPRIAGGVG